MRIDIWRVIIELLSKDKENIPLSHSIARIPLKPTVARILSPVVTPITKVSSSPAVSRTRLEILAEVSEKQQKIQVKDKSNEKKVEIDHRKHLHEVIARKRCCFPGCTDNNLSEGFNINRILMVPPELPADASRQQKIMRYKKCCSVRTSLKDVVFQQMNLSKIEEGVISIHIWMRLYIPR